MRWWFSRSFKSFYYLIQLLTFYLLHWNYFLILKMLTEILLSIPLSVIGRCSLVPTYHWLQRKCARINFHKSFQSDFTESQAAPCKYFQCQNRCFRLFEAGYRYWKVFHQLRNKNFIIIILQKIFISWNNPFKLCHWLRSTAQFSQKSAFA